MKIKTSIKTSEKNLDFYKKLNINLIKTDRTEKGFSYSDLQEEIVNFFKINNNYYLELLSQIGSRGKDKDGN